MSRLCNPSAPPGMKFLYLVFAVFLLVSLAAPALGGPKEPCGGRCVKKCDKDEVASSTYDCKFLCCTRPKKRQ
ncbi:Ovodefensin A1 precursor [Alligator mississippiensis]|uniref:Ovodefensin A1 n=1 Tax=Alligator mississippiensis TaxID=8496 RepID=A0A151MVH7_ALLMI|nr:Ovodefensin A1 precursor [Alligator mississippiensis]